MIDEGSLRGSVEGYIGRSEELFDADYLNYAEGELTRLQNDKGFSFPTNEGMRKVTKTPELNRLDEDPELSLLAGNIRTTIHGVDSKKEGGLYFGVNAFHHGHLAYLSESEAMVNVDMNKLVPYGFAFIVGMVGAIKTPEDFRNQVGAMAADPRKFQDFFRNTRLEETILVQSESDEAVRARRRLITGFMETMDEFDPAKHGSNKVPPVFCHNTAAYDYFRTLAVQDKIAGIKGKLEGKGFVNLLAKAMNGFPLKKPELNTVYASSVFDPRFAGPKERKSFIKQLRNKGHNNFQVIESFLNSGWVVYDIESHDE
jgi:hypothetical protein